MGKNVFVFSFHPPDSINLVSVWCFASELRARFTHHSLAAWWNSQSSCAGLLPRSSQIGGKGS